MTPAEALEILGPEAVAAAVRIAADAPPLTREQRAALAVLLRRTAEQPDRQAA